MANQQNTLADVVSEVFTKERLFTNKAFSIPNVAATQDTIVTTLNERGNNYGSFIDNACIAQDLKTTLRKGASWNTMHPDQKESLEMIVHKIARIINGNPDYVDSWHDIIGYATLVRDRLEKNERS